MHISYYFSDIESKSSIDMYNYGNKSSFDFDQGLKVLLRLNESDDFYYNVPLQGAQVWTIFHFTFKQSSITAAVSHINYSKSHLRCVKYKTFAVSKKNNLPL